MSMIPIINMPDAGSTSPQTDISFYRGVPWDNTYTHVRMYDTRADLDTFLQSKRVKAITQAAPVRIGTLDVNVPFDEMAGYKLNYCRFLNRPFDMTPHYAFITGVEWLSEKSSRLTIELDVWNECQFDADFSTLSWIERAHVARSDDIIGKWTYPEGLETGELISIGNMHQAPTATELSSKAVVFATTFDLSLDVSPVGLYQGTYSGLSYIILPLDQPDDIDTINNWLTTIFEKNLADGIVNAYIVPASFAVPNLTRHKISINKPYNGFGTYVPKCNKCYCYPFKKLVATDNNGNTTEYRYELFFNDSSPGSPQSSQVEFAYYLNTTAEPTLIMYPLSYRSINNPYMFGMSTSNFTKIAIATDTYKMWLAQNSALLDVQKMQIEADAAIGSARAILAPLKLDFAGALSGAAETAINTGVAVEQYLAEKESHKIVSPGMSGVQSNGLMAALNINGFRFYTMECQEEYIKKIDNFFWCFGYSIGDYLPMTAVKNRKYWNYIKTIGCPIKGKFPIDMMRKFRAIFDNGVTVWHTDDIGNYNLNNNA